jgi:hypothetical protein
MSATSVKCSECNKTVYPLEKVTITDGRNFHKVRIAQFAIERIKKIWDRLN